MSPQVYLLRAPEKKRRTDHFARSRIFSGFLAFLLAFAAAGRYSSPGKLTGPEAGNCRNITHTTEGDRD